jgi:ABC-type glutathione transport system ATPase component
MSLLDVESLSIDYAGESAVNKLSFSVARGESVGLVGESGSGKTQTALAILGLLPSNANVSGSVKLGGIEVLGAREAQLDSLRARRVAMVFQDPALALNPYVRVGRQLQRILTQHKLATGAQAKARVIDMLGRVGLPDAERQYSAYPHELSGGMRQRAMIAAALIAEPELLIADEPTTALDVTVQAQILELLEELREDTALLLITHDLGIVAGHCERMLVLEHGRLVEAGVTRDVFASPQTDYTERLIAAAPRLDCPDIPTPASGAQANQALFEPRSGWSRCRPAASASVAKRCRVWRKTERWRCDGECSSCSRILLVRLTRKCPSRTLLPSHSQCMNRVWRGASAAKPLPEFLSR